MNNVGQAMLPVTPIAATAPAPSAQENEGPGDSGGFDSILQQRTDQSPDGTIPTKTIAQSRPIEDQTKPDIGADAPNAASQAGLFAMFPPSAIPPLPVPLPTPLQDDTFADPISDNGAREITAASSEPTDGMLLPIADATTPTPLSPPPFRAARPIAVANSAHPLVDPLAESIVEAAPLRQEAKPLISKEVTSQFDVSNVLGIIPPVQAAPDVSVESAVPSPPIATTVVATANSRTHDDSRLGEGERIGAITPVGSFERAQESVLTVPTATVAGSSHPHDNAFSGEAERVVQIAPAIPFSRAQTSLPTFGNDPAFVAVSMPESAPANFAAPAVQHIPAEMTVPAHDTRNTLPQPVTEPIFAVSEATNITGMVAAKPGRVMPSATPQRVPQTAPAVSVEPASNAAMADTLPAEAATSPRSTAVPSARNGRENSAEDNAANTDRNPTTEFSAMDLPRVVATASTGAHSSAPVRSTDVAQIVTHTLQASEQLRATGLQRMEVAVKLDSGHDLTIQLRIENGQVTPVIRTASEPLRTALEQNWSLFAQRTGDRELRISTPVFESPQTSSNMSDLNQQRDGHQRAFNEPAPENFQSSPQRRNTPPQIPRPASTSAGLAEGVRLYA